MEFDTMFKEAKFEAVKDKIDPTLLANPAFMGAFNRACRNAHGMTGRNTYHIYVSDDGKLVSITDEGKEHNCREELKDNRIVTATNITLDGDTMNVEFCSGTLYKAEDYNKIGVYIPSQFKSVLNTYYSNDIYDEKGIQLGHSWYGDSYSLDTGLNSVNLREQTLSKLHKPNFKYNMIAEHPIFYNNASAGCIYRTYDNLGLAYKTYAEGMKPYGATTKVTHDINTVSTEYPERLSLVPLSVATWSPDDRDYVVSSYLYGDMPLKDVCDQIKANFRAGLENSKTKEYDIEMYQRLVETAEKTLTR